ncbi:FAD-dependent oxidoreductase [Candidatus Lokiarchaeum ossiferum]|uniref:FAD-dependent oxidoreductase n=1 Tax=Candidatus Lokiarchaeum ossiferum TaxID=2951803 RepID=UPI00352DEEA2
MMADEYLSMCTTGGADFIKKNVDDFHLNRIVVAACTPKTHEPVFRAVLDEIGIDTAFLEFINLREHCSFVHRKTKDAAMEKAKDLISAGVSRAHKLENIPELIVPITDSVLVIGGGVAGLQAALDLGNQGIRVCLVEEKPTIGGKMAMLDRTFPTDDCSI